MGFVRFAGLVVFHLVVDNGGSLKVRVRSEEGRTGCSQAPLEGGKPAGAGVSGGHPMRDRCLLGLSENEVLADVVVLAAGRC